MTRLKHPDDFKQIPESISTFTKEFFFHTKLFAQPTLSSGNDESENTGENFYSVLDECQI
jgi:hypothetical protein